MSSGENFADLYSAVVETERNVIRYAQERLMYATVDVTIKECDYPFGTLPYEFHQPMEELGKPVKNIASMDMRLAYDRSRLRFVPRQVSLKLDNSCTFSFTQIYGTRATAEDGAGANFLPILLDEQGNMLKRPEEIAVVSENLLNGMLAEIGLEIPQAPQLAEWQEIQKTLQFSNRWAAVAADSVPLDLMNSVYVEERLDGRGFTGDPQIDEDTDDADPTPHITEITLSLDKSEYEGDVATSALKFVLATERPDELPRYLTMTKVPIQYGAPFLGYPATERIDDSENAQTVIPSKALLASVNTAIEQARAFEDPFPKL